MIAPSERIPGMAALSTGKPGPYRASITLFSGFYRIVEPNGRTVRGFTACRKLVFTS
jgi:hypothetical protein